MAAKKARGRKPDASSKSGQIRELLKTGMSPMEIAKKVSCTPGLVYNIKSQLAGGTKKRKAGRGPGRPPKALRAASAPVGADLGGLLESVRRIERERADLRAALEKMQSILADALGS